MWLSGATFKAVPVDKIGLHYSGGLFQGQHFKGVISPGTHTKYYGEFDRIYLLPSTQRTYIVSKDPQAGDVKAADFISAPSSDNVPFTFEAAVYFKLNPKPSVLRQFFEQICLHDNCTDEGCTPNLSCAPCGTGCSCIESSSGCAISIGAIASDAAGFGFSSD